MVEHGFPKNPSLAPPNIWSKNCPEREGGKLGSNNNNTFFENYSAKPISTSGRVSRQGARATGMTLPSARALLCNFGATGLSALWGGERLAHLLYTSVCSQGPWPPAKKKKKKTTQREQAAAENDKKNARK